MRLLLDTNILIPIIHETLDHIQPHLREAVRSPDAVLHASVASLWEIAIKVRIGKLALGTSVPELPALFESLGLVLVTIGVPHVIASVDPEPKTRDPFDRLLLAQCLVEDLRLVTTDRVLAAHPLSWHPA